MKKVVVVRYSEIGLKGKNRRSFEEVLKRNIKNFTGYDVVWKWGRLYVEVDWEKIELGVFKKVFGIQNFSPALLTGFEWEEIKQASRFLVSLEVENGAKKFKVNAKRTNKNFPMGIYDVNKELGAFILKNFDLTVDVHNPDFELGVEIRDEGVILYTKKISGSGGLPVGVSGKGLLLLSGGIDSPVAGWYMMKRGVKISALSFISPPYTGSETINKIKKITEKLKEYSSGHSIKLYFASLTPVLELLQDRAPERYILVLQRRSMMRIAERLADYRRIPVLITGESVGQVASQTLQNLRVIEEACTLPVIRPLAGFDKVEIVEKAKEIGTYEVSILEHPDVCSMFTPKKPATAAKLEYVKEIEEDLGVDLKKAEDEVYYNIEREDI